MTAPDTHTDADGKKWVRIPVPYTRAEPDTLRISERICMAESDRVVWERPAIPEPETEEWVRKDAVIAALRECARNRDDNGDHAVKCMFEDPNNPILTRRFPNEEKA